MSYNPTLESNSLGDLKLYVILLFGNICCIPWLRLWSKDYPQPLMNLKYTIELKFGFALRKERHLFTRLSSWG